MDFAHPRGASLPPEIWISIFEHATNLPGTLIPDIYDHAGAIGPVYNNSHETDLREVLATKRAVVRVCKQWWHLAAPRLYRSVYINRPCALASLRSTLAVPSSQPLGKYTERLDIAIRDRWDGLFGISNLLPMVITHMPRLAIVSFVRFCTADSWDPDFPSHILNTLQSRAPSLRVLDWSTTQAKPTCSQVTDFLHKCPQLRIFHCPRLFWTNEFDLALRVLPSTLTTLSLSIMCRTPTLPPPSLNFDPDIVNRPGLAALQDLTLELHATPLHWIHLLFDYNSQLATNLPIGLEHHLRAITQACPDLRRLTLASACFICFSRPNLAFPPITYLGLRATLNQSPRQDYKMLFEFLEDLRVVSRVPSLRVVQLLNEHNLECMFNKHTEFIVRALEPFMENAPFRLEDKDGVLLTDRLRMLGHL